MIVGMAVVTTMAMPPMLRWALARLPVQEEEQARLVREAFEAKDFITNVERLLLAVDDSPNGKLALRLASLIAASRGITTTVLHLGRGNPDSAVKAAVEVTEGSAAPSAEGRRKVHVTLRTDVSPTEAAITKEAQKGYGLLVLGLAKTLAPHGGFHEEISRITATYEGPLAVVVARGPHVEFPGEGDLNLLVPIRGNRVSRRAAEVALALAQVSDSPMMALYVLSKVGLGAAPRPTPTRPHEQAVLKDIVDLAERYGRSIRTMLRLDIAAENAILRQARLGNYNLIVMGVTRPAGATLYFGKIAAAILENSTHSILFVSS
jgi:nucleotide-binding universal stress UspA family protein